MIHTNEKVIKHKVGLLKVVYPQIKWLLSV